MPNKPMMFRPSPRARKLVDAIRAQTGMTITQVIILAIELLAEKYKIKLPKDDTP